MREVRLSDNPQAFEFAEKLFRGDFDMMILLTGVGTRLLNDVVSTRHPEDSFKNALRALTVVVRGSKPMAVLRAMGYSGDDHGPRAEHLARNSRRD